MWASLDNCGLAGWDSLDCCGMGGLDGPPRQIILSLDAILYFWTWEIKIRRYFPNNLRILIFAPGKLKNGGFSRETFVF